MDEYNSKLNALIDEFKESMKNLGDLNDHCEGHGVSELELAEREVFKEYLKRVEKLKEDYGKIN